MHVILFMNIAYKYTYLSATEINLTAFVKHSDLVEDLTLWSALGDSQSQRN